MDLDSIGTPPRADSSSRHQPSTSPHQLPPTAPTCPSHLLDRLSRLNVSSRSNRSRSNAVSSPRPSLSTSSTLSTPKNKSSFGFSHRITKKTTSSSLVVKRKLDIVGGKGLWDRGQGSLREGLNFVAARSGGTRVRSSDDGDLVKMMHRKLELSGDEEKENFPPPEASIPRSLNSTNVTMATFQTRHVAGRVLARRSSAPDLTLASMDTVQSRILGTANVFGGNGVAAVGKGIRLSGLSRVANWPAVESFGTDGHCMEESGSEDDGDICMG